MKTFTFRTTSKRLLADTITPVSIFLKIRDIYPNSILLESSDYHGNENSYSFICLKPVATFIVDKGEYTAAYPDGSSSGGQLDSFEKRFKEFMSCFKPSATEDKIPVNGFFGYTSYDAVRYFEKISLKAPVREECKIPEICYGFYSYIMQSTTFRMCCTSSRTSLMVNSVSVKRLHHCLEAGTLHLIRFILKETSIPTSPMRNI